MTTMMEQYLKIKEQHKDCLLFFRLGDFYELFFEDAELCSRELDLVLTGRDCGMEKRAPMCGVPFHAVDTYLNKLVKKGYKVAICEQMSEPVARQIVDRDVVRIVTAGTLTETDILDEATNNYLASVCYSENGIGLSWCDLSTGEFLVNGFDSTDLNALSDALVRIRPVEIICNSSMLFLSDKLHCIKAQVVPLFKMFYDWAYEYEAAKPLVGGLISSESKTSTAVVCAAGALFEYLKRTQKRTIANIQAIEHEDSIQFIQLDANTRRNLELTQALNDRRTNSTLLNCLDYTGSPMGKRLLKKWIDQPLYNKPETELRLQAVATLFDNQILRQNLHGKLKKVKDFERCATRVAMGTANPKDLVVIRDSLSAMPEIKSDISQCCNQMFISINNEFDCLEELCALLQSSIVDEPSTFIKDGGVIRSEYCSELNELRNASQKGATLIAGLTAREKEQTGIKTLKIAFNKVFGYYIEVTNSLLDLVPMRYVRKQTLSNCERYITPELKELEDIILNSESKIIALENEIFKDICSKVRNYIGNLQNLAKLIAKVDCICSFAITSCRNDYVCPQISDDKEIIITEGRHPVVEILQREEARIKKEHAVSGAKITLEKQFVPNDTFLDAGENRTMIITGPNMAGKSTYMRQVALIVLMAHMGCFVPAKQAKICLVDKIFTRIGASDDLALGYSTFMVEMLEVSNIIKNATKDSLLILDEIGRGTATYDGLSIAWSVMEYLSKNLIAKTLFSTHFHELTELEEKLDGVKNYRISVREAEQSIIFLRKIVRGQARKSFGIEVAALAGMPEEIVGRSRELLKLLQDSDIVKKYNSGSESLEIQASMFDNSQNAEAKMILEILDSININNITPIQSIEILSDLIDRRKNI